MDQPPYTQYIDQEKIKKTKETSQSRAKIDFPPQRLKNEMKKTHKGGISPLASVYAAASIEYFVKVIIKSGIDSLKEKPGKKQKKAKKFKVMKSRSLYLSMQKNQGLEKFLLSSNALILFAGVKPEAIERTKKERELKKEIKEMKKETTEQIKKKKSS